MFIKSPPDTSRDIQYMGKLNRLPALTVLALLFLITGPVEADREPFNLVEISDGIFLHRGVNAAFGAPGHDDIANIGFIVGDKCVAVIDTGGSVAIGEELHSAIRSETDKPICYVINTHVHFDHVLGNLAFAGDKPEFIGHAKLADAIEANRDFFLREFGKYLGESPTRQSIIGPTTTVDNSLTVDLGNRKLLLTAYPPAHTYTDLTVFDQKTGTLWTGDLVFREHVPVIDGSLKGWLAVMDKLVKIDVACIIPGHGPPGKTWPEVTQAQQEYLNKLLDETRKAIAGGMFMEEAVDTIGLDEKDKWKLFDEHHKKNVSRAFVELEWE